MSAAKDIFAADIKSVHCDMSRGLTETLTYGGADYDCISDGLSKGEETDIMGQVLNRSITLQCCNADFTVKPTVGGVLVFKGEDYRITGVAISHDEAQLTLECVQERG